MYITPWVLFGGMTRSYVMMTDMRTGSRIKTQLVMDLRIESQVRCAPDNPDLQCRKNKKYKDGGIY